MNKQYKLFLYRVRYKGIEIPLYAPTEIEKYFYDNGIRYARNMLYKPFELNLKEVEKITNEIAEMLDKNKIFKSKGE